LHATTTATITTTTASVAFNTKAEDTEVKILGNVEGKGKLIQNILSAYRLSNGRISNIFGMVNLIKLILPGHLVGIFN